MSNGADWLVINSYRPEIVTVSRIYANEIDIDSKLLFEFSYDFVLRSLVSSNLVVYRAEGHYL